MLLTCGLLFGRVRLTYGFIPTDSGWAHLVCPRGLTADKRSSALGVCLLLLLSLRAMLESQIWTPGELVRIFALDLPFKHVRAICACWKGMLIMRGARDFIWIMLFKARCVAYTATRGHNEPCKHTPWPPRVVAVLQVQRPQGDTACLCRRHSDPRCQAPTAINQLLFQGEG